MKLDSAIVKALSLDPAATTVAAHGGSGFSTTAKITTKTSEGQEKAYFMKTGKGKDAEVMFEGEHASLNAIHNAVPSLCPASFAHGRLTDTPSAAFLVTDFLDMSSGSSLLSSSRSKTSTQSARGSGLSLAAKLAKLHTTPAPTPDGHSAPVFGFPSTTCCGSTPQPNPYTASWADFYAEHRLRFILHQSEAHNGADKELRALVECMIERVVPRLLSDAHLNGGKGVVPVVVHGDLWAGNKGRGRIGSSADAVPPEDIVFDPSAAYAHAEYEHGIMRMFGGFDASFWSEYHRLCPKTEPVDEYDDRVALYELYHHLNHHSLFGGGYRGGAVGIMRGLKKKYGDGK